MWKTHKLQKSKFVTIIAHDKRGVPESVTTVEK